MKIPRLQMRHWLTIVGVVIVLILLGTTLVPRGQAAARGSYGLVSGSNPHGTTLTLGYYTSGGECSAPMLYPDFDSAETAAEAASVAGFTWAATPAAELNCGREACGWGSCN
ncbi:MAG: hypothetical protein OXH70_17150 [Acidobacteria bacterium]|nr:hypothetical protein [Acidobacteriota bacterium]